MNEDDLVQNLEAKGHVIGNTAIRTDGMLLLNIDNVFMFRPDAVDLANGTATLDDILRRNKGKVFPDATQ